MKASFYAPLRPKLPTKPIPNPNNESPGQPMQVYRLATFPAYSISSLDCNDIHLRSGRKITKYQPLVTIEYINEDIQNKESE
jgi:hypothetical protein